MSALRPAALTVLTAALATAAFTAPAAAWHRRPMYFHRPAVVGHWHAVHRTPLFFPTHRAWHPRHSHWRVRRPYVGYPFAYWPYPVAYGVAMPASHCTTSRRYGYTFYGWNQVVTTRTCVYR